MKFRQIKFVYVLSSAIILLAAILVSGYYVYTGFLHKNEDKIENNTSSQNTSQSSDASKTTNYQLIISKINISAPINTSVDGNNKDEYNKSLESGVAQLKGSALPGRDGNVFIFGHSSYFADKPGNFKEIFAKLNDLINGDIIEIQSQQARYIYRVSNKKIVEPNDVSVATQNYALKQLTLMTCWPIGTTDKRLVVISDLVDE